MREPEQDAVDRCFGVWYYLVGEFEVRVNGSVVVLNVMSHGDGKIYCVVVHADCHL